MKLDVPPSAVGYSAADFLSYTQQISQMWQAMYTTRQIAAVLDLPYRFVHRCIQREHRAGRLFRTGWRNGLPAMSFGEALKAQRLAAEKVRGKRADPRDF